MYISPMNATHTHTIEISLVYDEIPLEGVMSTLLEGLAVTWKYSPDNDPQDYPTVLFTGSRDDLLTVLDRYFVGSDDPEDALERHLVPQEWIDNGYGEDS